VPSVDCINVNALDITDILLYQGHERLLLISYNYNLLTVLTSPFTLCHIRSTVLSPSIVNPCFITLDVASHNIAFTLFHIRSTVLRPSIVNPCFMTLDVASHNRVHIVSHSFNCTQPKNCESLLHHIRRGFT